MEKQIIIDTFNAKRDYYTNLIMASFKPESNVSVTEKQWLVSVMKELVSENGLDTFRCEYKLKEEDEALVDTIACICGELLPQIAPSFSSDWDKKDAKLQKSEDKYIGRKDVFHKNFIKQ